MNKIQVLDCTLRDGGYCNQWNFGLDNTKKIVQCLVDADIDIIECGFLTNTVIYDSQITKFTRVSEITSVLPKERKGKIFVVLMNYGEYNMDDLPDYDGSSIDGIRVAFHKKDVKEALDVCRVIKEKGYKVFIQAMVSLSYTDEEFLSLLRAVNELGPYAFYIVDSFGMMKKKNLLRLFYMVENNLTEGILIGYHSHNNMQLAYSNAQNLVETQTIRNLIIDASIYGMGRGAGNLNTELFVEYLNETAGASYSRKPLLNVIDEILNAFYHQYYWGYSLPNYLSATHYAHPSYAGYLSEKNTLTVEAIDEIFALMTEEKKLIFDKTYIEELYTQYMATGSIQEEHLSELRARLEGGKVLLIAPGKSCIDEKSIIMAQAEKDDVITISVNFEYPCVETDFIFLSNLRRFRDIKESKKEKCIVTSNIPADKVYLQTKYYNLLNSIEAIKDNAGMMAIQFLIDLGVNEVILAGFDGYSHDSYENYASQQLAMLTKNAIVDAMNMGIHTMLEKFRKETHIRFLTKTKFS